MVRGALERKTPQEINYAVVMRSGSQVVSWSLTARHVNDPTASCGWYGDTWYGAVLFLEHLHDAGIMSFRAYSGFTC